jgi:acetylornithine deacetylase/succinyl-diaminopimelate desuccinylase-like protein
VGASMHRTDECVKISELSQLVEIYATLIGDFCG